MHRGWLIIIVLMLSACQKKECFEVSSRESVYYLEEMQSLFTYQYISGIWLQDTLTKDWQFWKKTANRFQYISEADDCGNKWGSYIYKTEFLQEKGVNFFLEFVGKDKYRRYVLHFFIVDSVQGIFQEISYDLVGGCTLEDSTHVKILKDYEHRGKIYDKVFKFEFQNILSSEAVRSFYYTGQAGLLGFERSNGKVFN